MHAAEAAPQPEAAKEDTRCHRALFSAGLKKAIWFLLS